MMLLNIADILYELFTVELKYDAKICCEEVSEKTMHLLNHKKSVFFCKLQANSYRKKLVSRQQPSEFGTKTIS